MPTTQKTSKQIASPSPALSTIRVYNTLSKAKETLEPVTPGNVGIYLCGPTVYKPSHIGHMVGPVIFDAIKRYLSYCGYQVTWVVNITDVDDKLIAESNRRGISMSDVAQEMTADYHRNLQAMGVDTIDHFPKATENMDEIISLTQTLIEKGFAYQSEGDVYFDVGRDPEYGKLSRRSIESMQGEGGEMAERKRSPADFALWKSAKPGEPSWDSPWGAGRPGWHIECSAMSRRLLGETFDIHGGGLDLVFPHHENEIAQSECCHGKPQAKYWLHNGLMQSSNEAGKVGGRATRALPNAGDQSAQEEGKMGKSKGAQPFSDLLKRFPPETIRFFLLRTHYRSPIDYSEDRIAEAGTALDTFYRYFKRYERVTGENFYSVNYPARRAEKRADSSGAVAKEIAEHRQRFLAAMDDDFNTGGAVGDLFDIVRILNKYIEDNKLENKAAHRPEHLQVIRQGTETLRELAATLGLFRAPVQETFGDDDALVGQLIGLLIELRASSRKNKDFATADKIRQELTKFGIVLEDRTGGTEWTKAK